MHILHAATALHAFPLQAAANSPFWHSRRLQATAMAALPIPARELFINGRWVAPVMGKYLDVVCPATEAVIGRIPAGAVAAGVRAAILLYSNCSAQVHASL
jgi:hypothetical protein